METKKMYSVISFAAGLFWFFYICRFICRYIRDFQKNDPNEGSYFDWEELGVDIKHWLKMNYLYVFIFFLTIFLWGFIL